MSVIGLCQFTGVVQFLKAGSLPSELKKERTWQTRSDPFDGFWDELRDNLAVNPGFEAKTLFDDLQRRFPGKFSDGQLRTLQRRVKCWRALEGPSQEIFFPRKNKKGISLIANPLILLASPTGFEPVSPP